MSNDSQLVTHITEGMKERSFLPDGTPITRLRTVSVDPAQQSTLNGQSYDWWWRIRDAANGSRTFARFTIPAGFYMAIENRIFEGNASEGYYRVYRPSDVNTAGITIGADLPIKSNLRNDAPIAFTGLANIVTLPTPPNRDLAFIEIPIFNVQGQSNTNAGELDAENAFRLLAPGSVFYLEMANSSTGGASTAYLKLRLIVSFINQSLVPAVP